MVHQTQSIQSDFLKEFLGPNAGYVIELYERYLRDPSSVPPDARAWFATWSPPPTAPTPLAGVSPFTIDQIVGASNLARAIRAYGHLGARLDPLGTPPPGDPSLEPASYGLTDADLERLPAAIVGGPVAAHAPNAAVAISLLRQIYCGTTGYEFRHVQSAAERIWLQNAVESRRFSDPNEPIDRRRILEQLTAVEAFERFLHRTFPGQKRFSIEGVDMLVPMLLELIGCAAEDGARSIWLGMAHRGRLSVLTQVLGKPPTEIFAEMHHAAAESVPPSERSDLGWTGDVTYHLGARTAFGSGRPVAMTVTLAPNPSHLEFVNPVVEGMCRASSERRDRPGRPERDEDRAIPVLVHGDAAFPGEGIVAETLNLSRLTGYRTGGTIHIITNNQLGFTTPPSADRSTLYASDLAKGFEIPIIHVNADDPEACIAAIRLAHRYRQQFHKDVLIDLIGYRRWGHNEADEPTYTQPMLYRRIQGHPTVRAIWAEHLAHLGEVSQSEAERMLREATDRLQTAYQAQRAAPSIAAQPAPEEDTPAPIVTAVPMDRLRRLNEQLHMIPAGFTVNPKLVRWIERRRAATETDGLIDWAHAEALAFASLLVDGVPIRLTGQDTARGTFSQRHLVLHDFETGATYIPLQALPEARASFEVYDSPLAEAAPLGFEYGYSTQAHDALVLWEAQFGDFANVAQVMIDQFIASGQAKWGQTTSLILLLPHGLEGQGPEHSSARVERFLQLAARGNMRIANCTTAAQYFHLLRRQAALLSREPRPLVIFTPKSLLRHPLAASHLSELASGAFQPVIDDREARARADRIRRLILCSGHVYVDLAASSWRAQHSETAIVRIEQLYPFPTSELAQLLASYPALREVIWVQEEPRNMGAWAFVEPYLRTLVGPRASLSYVGRPESASPAVGAHDLYRAEQEALVQAAFQPTAPTHAEPAPLEVGHGE
ncbi:MAG: 2-oxoglutarate dehydrogenase E1 component [Chloroflexi bacterium]|nr:2-oxoglutarate dehydrogenase E1 component [Chloroflexota bacterium]